VVKFTSRFKEKSTNLSSSKKGEPGLLPGNDNEKQESTNGSSPPTKLGKAKQLLSQVKLVTSGILAKLPGSEKPLYRRYWLWAGLGVSSGIIAVSYGVWSIDKTLPDKAELNAVVREHTLTIKAVDGTILQQQGEATREQLELKEIPDKLQKAFIASEDRRFTTHNGIDGKGIARAVWNNLRHQDVVQGGSTITQQLSRILFLKREQTIWRKLKEARLAQKMEEQLSKNEILERYLNLVYLGSGAYGVADAAWVYFSKEVDKLTLGEMAMIAALPPAPDRFSPQVNMAAAKQRRNLVLQRMLEDGHITASEKKAAEAEAIKLKTNSPKRWKVEAPYFISYIQKELPKYVSPEVLQAGGLTVETSLNPKWQKIGEEAVAKTLRNEGKWENFKQAALVAIEPSTGKIKAMVGGKDFDKNQFNRVTQAQRQPGSTFKGFVYAAAVATGMNPTDGYLDAPLVVDGYEPKNYDEGYRGWINMRDALTRSINIVAVRVLMKVGFEPTIKLAQNMGIKSELKPMYSLALGSAEVNLLELTSAYGTFANKGLHIEPHGINRILNRQGKVIWSSNSKPKRALDADSAAITTWMLGNVVKYGTGRAAQLGRPVAGKTGTTDEARDLWFVGFIPQLVTGVWLGNDDNKPTAGSSSTAAYTWHEFMEEAVKGMKVENFPKVPKLAGRKGTIKAQPIKPKRIINRPVTYQTQEDSNGESNRSGYRRSQQQSSGRRSSSTSSSNSRRRSSTRRSSYRRRSYTQQAQPQQRTQRATSSRSSRRRYRSQPSTSTQQSSPPKKAPLRQRLRRARTNSAPTPKNSTSPQRSWRERLRPSN
jgi:penicillin-binding protein 1A